LRRADNPKSQRLDFKNQPRTIVEMTRNCPEAADNLPLYGIHSLSKIILILLECRRLLAVPICFHAKRICDGR